MADVWETTDADVSNNNGVDGRKSNACFRCGEEGHRKSECPVGGGGNDTCFNCGEEGHRKSDCLTGSGRLGGGSNKCYNCGDGGHRSSDCLKAVTCRKCGGEGHKSMDCVGKSGEIKVNTEIYIPKEIEDEALFDQGISSGINFDKFESIQVKCTGSGKIPPISTFEDANLRSLLMDNVKKSGYLKPTPIQKWAIPIILAERDLMACAQTGSGKTAAFLLPILNVILSGNEFSSPGDIPQRPQAVIVAPTRELAIQIKDEARKFANLSVIRPVVVYGGTSSGFQLSQLLKGTDILIATPGRLMDFVDKGKISFENVKYLVLDEADRMLDMGFLPEITKITSTAGMPPKGTRNTLMFSATFPSEVQRLAREFLENYLFVTIGLVGGANRDVEQSFHQVERFSKRQKLKDVLDEFGTERTLVFVETKRNADFIASFLCESGYPTTSIHGDRLQREREMALADFKSGSKPILVATAVAARGLDIKGVSHVINYDLPKTIDEYVHRIGRTGRVGNLGKATSFYDGTDNKDLVQDLLNILEDCNVKVPEWLLEEADSFSGNDIREEGNGDDENWG